MRILRAAVASPGSGPTSGVVGEDILVLPDMAASHVDRETGGPMLHLAIVSRSIGKVIMVMPDAMSTLLPGMLVVLNPKLCQIIIVKE